MSRTVDTAPSERRPGSVCRRLRPIRAAVRHSWVRPQVADEPQLRPCRALGDGAAADHRSHQGPRDPGDDPAGHGLRLPIRGSPLCRGGGAGDGVLSPRRQRRSLLSCRRLCQPQHRVPVAPVVDATTCRHRRRHRRHGAELRRQHRGTARSCRRDSPTCSSTAARASPSAWRRTSRRTTSARSSTPPST